jgi:predicted transcriptional regulator
MPRKTVSLPADLQEQLEQLAQRRKVSFSWLVRDAVEKYLAADTPLFQRTT